jgi:hypothetical protein
MTWQGLRAVVLIGAACSFGRASAEPVGQAQTATTSTSVPAAAQPAPSCAVAADQASADCNGVFGVMMEYQKTVNKEAREDRRVARDSKAAATKAQASKIKVDNKAIDQGMTESRERADLATASQTPAPTGGVVGVKPASATGTISQVCQARAAECPPPCEGPCK